MQIKNLEQLDALRRQRKSITCPNYRAWVRSPAAWMMNLSGDTLIRLFRDGMFEYKPKPKKPRHFRFGGGAE